MTESKTFSRGNAIPLGLLCVMLGWFTHEMLLAGHVPFFRDLGPYFYPMRFTLSESLKRGELPLWDRHVGMGFPLLADFQSGTFYPPHIFFTFCSFFDATRTVFLFHYLVAAFGSYILARHWKYPPCLALIGAILFTFSGITVSLTNVLNHFQTAVWLPWVILFWERAVLFFCLRNFGYLVAALLFQFLAGSPEIYAISMGFLLLDSFRLRTVDETGRWRKTVLILGGANVLVLGLAMAQVLPTLELFFESRGRWRLDYPESSQWSLQPWSLVNLFFLDREANVNLHDGVRLFFTRKIPFFISSYIGVIPLFGIGLWFMYASGKERTLISGVILLLLVIALGNQTPIYSLFYASLPLLDLFRFPEKFLFPIYVILIFVTLRGLSEFSQRERMSTSRLLLLLAAVVVPWISVYILCRLDTFWLSGLVARVNQQDPSSFSILKTSSAVLFSIERQLAIVMGLALLFFLWKGRTARLSLVQGLVVAVVFVDVATANRPYQYFLDPQFVFEETRTLSAPDREPSRMFYLPALSALHPSFYILGGKKQPSFAEFNTIVFNNLLPNVGVFHGFEYMQETDALRRWPYMAFLTAASRLPPDKQFQLMGRLNVRYISSFQTLAEDGITLFKHFREYPSWVYEIDTTIPRVYIVSNTVEEADPLKLIERLASDEFDPFNEVLLEKPLPIRPDPAFQSKATIGDYTNHRVTIQASLNGPGILVLADSFYPGWRAFVNGREAEIMRANLFFRGVFLQAGEHRVEFRYQPRSFLIGLIVSLTTLAALVGVWIFVTLKRRRQASLVRCSSLQVKVGPLFNPR